MQKPDEPIPGIFDYCDRWCERCSLTARCALFAIEKEVEARTARGEDEDQAFWETMNAIYGREARSWEDVEAFDAEDPPKFDTGTTWSDSDGFSAFEGRRTPDGKHPLVHAAGVYGSAVDHWRASYEELVKGRRRSDDSVDVHDALEVIHWYQILIQTKLSRAVMDEPWHDGEIDELVAASVDDEPYLEALPSDADGSGKVALLGIERSFAAWSVLRDAFPEAANETADLMRRLMRLRHAVDAELPGARAFKRPGFDDGV